MLTKADLPTFHGRGIDVKKNVLLADDEPITRMLVASKLSDMGAHVIEVENGWQAIAAVERMVVDAIFVDLEMPEMDGWHFLEWLREHPKSYCGPTIVLSGLEHQGARDRAIANGAHDFFRKPLDWAKFEQCARRLLISGTG